MPHNPHQQHLELNTSSPTTPSTLTLASTLSFALAEIDRLKLEAKSMANRANYAENLLLPLVAKDNTRSASNTTSPSHAALSALAALMSAESRARATESRLAAVLGSLSELLRLNDPATGARRQFENTIGEERRKIVNSIETETKTGYTGHTSHRSSSFPNLPTQSAPLSFAVPARSSNSVPRLPIRSHLPTLPRVRPRIISELAGASQPPTKKLRTASSNANQMQPPASVYRQPSNIRPNNALRATVHGYRPTAMENASHLHQTQTPYPQPNNYSNQYRVSSNMLANMDSVMQNGPHQAHNSYPIQNNYSNQPRVSSNSPTNPNSNSVYPPGCYELHHTVYQQPPPPPPPSYPQQSPTNNISISPNNANRHSTIADKQSSSSHPVGDNGIPDHAPRHLRDGHSSQQDPGSVKLLDDGSHSNSKQQFLPQNGQIDVEREKEKSNGSFNDMLLEWTRRESDRRSKVETHQDRSEENSLRLHIVGAEGEKSNSVTKSDGNVAVAVVTHLQSQPRFPTTSSNQLKKDPSTSTVVVINTNDGAAEVWSGSPAVSPQSSISVERPRPTSTLTGLKTLGFTFDSRSV